MKKCFSCGSKFIVKSDLYNGYICGECGYFITYEKYNEYVKKYKEYIEKVKEERRKLKDKSYYKLLKF
jgi:DNA-directed RNA polymerase subunit M/transcription elongation factor TFIIS